MFASALLLLACGQPDLVVTTIESDGTPIVNADNSAEVPIQVVVRNQGSAAADVFKTAVDYTGSQGTFVVAFTVPGQTDIWYPHTSGSLAAGAEESFAGILTFHPSVHGETLGLHAVADSCSGDEFMPDYCRVQESDEANNRSDSLTVVVP
ncbi:MAG: CARDB domain-containing protein [Myxococcota bacterium]